MISRTFALVQTFATLLLVATPAQAMDWRPVGSHPVTDGETNYERVDLEVAPDGTVWTLDVRVVEFTLDGGATATGGDALVIRRQHGSGDLEEDAVVATLAGRTILQTGTSLSVGAGDMVTAVAALTSDFSGTATSIGVARRGAGGWGAMQELFPTLANDDDFLRIESEGDLEGNVVVAASATDGDVRLGDVPATGTLAVTTYAPSSASTNVQDLAVSENGRAVLGLRESSWDPVNGTTEMVTLLERTDFGQSWTQRVDATEASIGGRAYAVAVNDSGVTAVLLDPSVSNVEAKLYVADGPGQAFQTFPIPFGQNETVYITPNAVIGLDVAPDGTTRTVHSRQYTGIRVASRTLGANALSPVDVKTLEGDRNHYRFYDVQFTPDGSWLVLGQRHSTTTPIAWTELGWIGDPDGTFARYVGRTHQEDGALPEQIPMLGDVTDGGRAAFWNLQYPGDYTTRTTATWVLGTVGTAQITSGPTGATSDATPTFTFLDIGGDAGDTFECRVDLGSWGPCSSPFTTPTLVDGSHTFSVRVVTGGNPTTADTRIFNVDTTAPVVTITSAPPASSTATTATIVFDANEAVTFQCRLLPASFTACVSPAVYTGLTVGSHTFEVRATDGVGHVSTTRSAAFAVTSPSPGGDGGTGGGATGGGGSCAVPKPGTNPAAPPCDPPVECDEPKLATVTAGVLGVRARTVASCLRQTKSGTWVGSGSYFVNGLQYVGSIEIDKPSMEVTLTGSFQPGGWDGIRLRGSVWNVAGRSRRYSVSLPKGISFKKYAVEGSSALEFSADNGGTAKVDLDIVLPDFLKLKRAAAGTQARSLEGLGMGITYAARGDGTGVWSGRATFNAVYAYGKYALRNLGVAYDGETGAFSATGELLLGLPDKTPFEPVGVTVTMQGTTSKFWAISILAQRLNKPVGYGFFVQQLGGEFNTVAAVPFAALTAGVSLGPGIKFQDATTYAFLMTGTGKLVGDVDGPAMELEGVGTSFNQELSKMAVRWQSWDQSITGSFDGAFGVGGYGLFYSVRDAQLNPIGGNVLSIEGTGNLNLPGLGRHQVTTLMGLGGIAACTGPKNARAGSVYLFGPGRWQHSRTCDLGTWKQDIAIPVGAPADERARGRADAPLTTHQVTLASGLTVTRLAVRGTGGAPRIAVVAPDGTRTVMTGDTAVIAARLHVVPDALEQATFVTIWSPAKGSWRLEPLNGSVAITRVDAADGLPAPDVRASVTGRGDARVLRWQLRQIPEQRVTFLEEGRSGTRVLAVARGASGTIRFKPASGTPGRRTVVAVVEQYGNVRLRRVVARFTVAKAKPLAAPAAVRVVRGPRSVTLTFRPVVGARTYTAQLVLADGTRNVVISRRPRIAFAGVAATATGRIGLWASGASGDSRTVPAAVRTFRR